MQRFKVGEELNCKVELPHDFHWKVLQSLMTDLETSEAGNLIFEDKDEDIRKDVLHAIRMRCETRLRQAVSTFNPRSMIESQGTVDPSRFFARYQMSSFLKKYPEKGDGSRSKAIAKFLAVEEHCKLFNSENINSLLSLSDKHPDYFGVVDDLKFEIKKLLGEKPDLGLIYGLSKHGPGATVDSKQHGKGQCTSYYKWATLPYTVTPSALIHLRSAIFLDARWSRAILEGCRRKFAIPYTESLNPEILGEYTFKVVSGSRTVTVPKTSEIDRTIALEPTGNLFLQLGIDGYIRARLNRLWKVDLNTQTHNQLLAKEGSETGQLATLDLSSASDCVTLALCKLLLPESWYDLLTDLRSPVTTVDGQVMTLEKISSMGNGYTFALESLLFAAIVRVTMRRKRVSGKTAIYGDDIIVPTVVVPELVDLLVLSGFKINEDKSFVNGGFRESCGADWIHGLSVRPLFLTKQINSVPDLFYLHNALVALEERLDWRFCVDFTLTRAMIRRAIPEKFRKQFYGPPGDSLDTHLFSLKKGKHLGSGLYAHFKIRSKAKVYRQRQGDFFFRILMSSLRHERVLNKWELRRNPNTGNAFTITKRDRTTQVCSLGRSWISHDPSPLGTASLTL